MNKIKAFSKAKNMVMITENSKDTWYWLTPKVQTFVGNFHVGQEIEFTMEEKNGKNLINFIKATGDVSKAEVKSEVKVKESSTAFKCEDCSAVLKDNKYPTCYTCSMKRKAAVDSNFKPEVIKEEKITEYKCTECGVGLANDSYSTCYTCSMKLKVATNKSPQQQDSIKRQAIGHMTSRTLISLQGHIDLDNIYKVSEKLYAHYQKLVG